MAQKYSKNILPQHQHIANEKKFGINELNCAHGGLCSRHPAGNSVLRGAKTAEFARAQRTLRNWRKWQNPNKIHRESWIAKRDSCMRLGGMEMGEEMRMYCCYCCWLGGLRLWTFNPQYHS